VLVVSRKEDQEIVFPELGIRVTILKIRGSVTRIGIEAPKQIRVIRGELEQQFDHRPVDRSAASEPSEGADSEILTFEWTTT
jgi:carbon storage regulator